MEQFIIIGGSVSLGLVILFSITAVVNNMANKKIEQTILTRFDKDKILSSTTRSNFFGEKSKGPKQVFGKGGLVITENELYFIRAYPQAEFSIPIKAITQTSLPKRFNGKSVFVELLCVEYTKDGTTDAMAWSIKSPEKWKALIDKIAQLS